MAGVKFSTMARAFSPESPEGQRAFFPFFKKGRSLLHKTIQNHIVELLHGEVVAEYLFDSIGRKADLFWEKKGIVFEVQCSPITVDQIKARTEDYESIGLYPIWLLHERLYGKVWQSAAERFIRKEKKAYYIRSKEKLFFYDIAAGEKILPIALHRPLFKSKQLSFEGDAASLSLERQERKRAISWHFIWMQSCLKIEKWIDRQLEKDHSC